MRTDWRPKRNRRSVNLKLNVQPHPREALSPEAPSRLAQQIATILQRILAEGQGRVDRVRRGH